MRRRRRRRRKRSRGELGREGGRQGVRWRALSKQTRVSRQNLLRGGGAGDISKPRQQRVEKEGAAEEGGEKEGADAGGRCCPVDLSFEL